MPEKYSDLLDSTTVSPVAKRSRSVLLLIIAASVIALTFLIFSMIPPRIGMKYNLFGALSLMISFGINIAGLIIGFTELSKTRRKAIIGIIGNTLLILFFMGIVTFAFSQI